MMINRDKRGIEGYPLQLMIVVIILAVSLPIIFSAFDFYKRAQAESATEIEVRRLTDAIVQTYNQGLGARTIIDVEFPDYLDYVKVGGNRTDTQYRSTIRYKVVGLDERTETITDGMRAIITEANFGDALTLTAGSSLLILEKMQTTQDLDRDGISGDYYIQIRVA